MSIVIVDARMRYQQTDVVAVRTIAEALLVNPPPTFVFAHLGDPGVPDGVDCLRARGIPCLVFSGEYPDRYLTGDHHLRPALPDLRSRIGSILDRGTAGRQLVEASVFDMLCGLGSTRARLRMDFRAVHAKALAVAVLNTEPSRSAVLAEIEALLQSEQGAMIKRLAPSGLIELILLRIDEAARKPEYAHEVVQLMREILASLNDTHTPSARSPF